MLTGENGIISQAQKSKKQTEKSGWEERIDLAISGTRAQKENPTIDDIIKNLIAEDVIDSEDQVNKETGDITTNKPTYVISEKLNDFISSVNIVVSKEPETEIYGGVKLKVEKIEGLKLNINDIDISKLNEEEKKSLAKLMYIGYENHQMQQIEENLYIPDFEYVLKYGFQGNEEKFWEYIFGICGENIENYLNAMLYSMKEENIESIDYYATNPEGKESNTYYALENGTYEFSVTDLITKKVYTKSIEVNNIDTNMNYYFIDGYTYLGQIILKDKNNNITDFEQAYIWYNNEKLDISSCITNEEYCALDVFWISIYLQDNGKIENNKDLRGVQKVEIVKDGKSYSENIVMNWAE